MLVTSLAQAEIQIEPQTDATPDGVAAARLLRSALAAAPSRLTALNVRVTIGAAAFENALNTADDRPIVAAFLTSTEFEGALTSKGQRKARATAIFSNPDPRDQVALAQLLLGRSAVGVLDSPATHHLVERIADGSVRAITVSPNQSIDSLLRAADSVDVIIALPDSSILNRSNINHVVRTLYQRRKVLIGYSVTLTRVGSLASVYVPPEAVAQSILKVLEEYAESNSLPAPLFVREVDVALNERLARSLNITIPGRNQLMDGIRSRRQ
jgi:hypothetical protein